MRGVGGTTRRRETKTFGAGGRRTAKFRGYGFAREMRTRPNGFRASRVRVF